MAGGKGGFGSMLRAIGAQIEKTTNKEACRDLSGRRIRDVNIERRFRNWVAKAAERKKEQTKRKKEKLERLRRVPKFEFKDEQYFKVRSEIPEKIDAALEYALHKSKNKSTASATVTSATVTSAPCCSSSATLTDVENQETTKVSVPVKRKILTKLTTSKKSRLWINDDLEVSDEEEESTSKTGNVDQVKQGDDGITSVEKEAVLGQKENFEQPPTEDSSIDNHEETIEPETSLNDKQLSSDQVKALPFKEGIEPKELDLEAFNSKEELLLLGLDQLKASLLLLGVKCGGTLEQRAERLWSVRGLVPSKIPKNLLALKSKK